MENAVLRQSEADVTSKRMIRGEINFPGFAIEIGDACDVSPVVLAGGRYPGGQAVGAVLADAPAIPDRDFVQSAQLAKVDLDVWFFLTWRTESKIVGASGEQRQLPFTRGVRSACGCREGVAGVIGQ